MRSNAVSFIALALIAALNACGCAPASRVEPAGSTADAEVAALQSFDDATLASRFLEAIKDAGYPGSRSYNPSVRVNAKRDAEISAYKTELRRRGTVRLLQLRRIEGPINAKSLSDPELLILLHGILQLNLVEHTRGCKDPYCTAIIHALLARGGFWDRLAESWEWRGLAALSDQRLRELWDLAQPEHPLDFSQHREALLMEISRRGGKEWEEFLQNWVKAVRSRPSNPNDTYMDRSLTLDVLTTLRRVQKKPDPVVIRIAQPLQQVVEFPQRPVLDVSLFNQDDETIQYKGGGDYRSGRLTRWRIESVDDDGENIPVWRPSSPGGIDGGLEGIGNLRPQGSWRTTLNAAAYLPALTAGEYTLRVLYHDTRSIAYDTDVSDLIVCSSPEIHLTVKPLRVTLSAADEAEIKSTVRRTQDMPKIAAGTYGQWAHEFIPPASDRGRVLFYGLRAVPPLLEMLRERDLAVQQRAEILCLLFNLTGENDPRYVRGPVIGAYEATERHFLQGGAIEMASQPAKVADGHIDVAEQEAFAKRWRSWKRSFLVERPNP